MVNSGTGADGKSTFTHIVSTIFGSYYASLPSGGLSVDAKNSNDATPVLNSLVGRRICITPDAKDVSAMMQSSTFKSVSGGDEIYTRRLNHEASDNPTPLKLLCIVNTNQVSIPLTKISELTRIKITKWENKTITDDDRSIIPSHQAASSRPGLFKFQEVFLKQYAAAMMLDLIIRHVRIKKNNYQISICDTIRNWTIEMIEPITVRAFMAACTYSVEPPTDINESSALTIQGAGNYGEVTVSDLFLAYTNWKKSNGTKLTRSDPLDLESFKDHLDFRTPVKYRKSPLGIKEAYVVGIEIRPEYKINLGPYAYSDPGSLSYSPAPQLISSSGLPGPAQLVGDLQSGSFTPLSIDYLLQPGMIFRP
jgi:hypothetical protein